MTTQTRNWLCAIAVLVLIPTALVAANRRPSVAKSSAKPAADAKSVEMFAAMKSGDIDVQIIPKDSTEARILVTNKTKQPLRIEMPAAFAAMPVLAQFGGGGGGNRPGGMTGGMNQGGGGGMGGGMMGGGMMGGGGMGGGGMGGGGGFFNVAPEKVGQIKVGLVCLEHGKKDPRPGVPYEIKPIEALSKNPAVREMLHQFANDRYTQRSAQVAAWHLNNNMSWQELAEKVIPHLNAPAEPYFSRAEIEAGMRVAEEAQQLAVKNAKPEPSAETSAGK